MRLGRPLAVGTFLLVTLGGVLPVVAAQPARQSTVFVVPPELRPQVEFWKSIFATYSRKQVVIHDTANLARVYSVLDFRSADDAGQDGLIEARVNDEKERIRSLLLHLHQCDGSSGALTPEEQRIARLFANDHSAGRFLAATASDRIRSQSGLRERFAAGVEIGHRYFPEMEAIFAAEGVPPQLTRLPLVESCFNVHAYSKVGAAGIWQFMPTTGRRFLRVDTLIDERRDPIESTRAAARFLRENYEKLGAWPLALTAYNHGPAGVARAVREVGTTDIVRIINEYQGPAFKFASRNFYPEFLAALDVERNHAQHFGELTLMQPQPTRAVPLSHPIEIRTAAAYAGVDRDVLADMNPSLAPLVEDGRRPIPAGYQLRVPAAAKDRFTAQYREYATNYDRRPRTRAARTRRGHTSVAKGTARHGGVVRASAKSAKTKTAKNKSTKAQFAKASKAGTSKKGTPAHRARQCKGRCGIPASRLAPDEVGPQA